MFESMKKGFGAIIGIALGLTVLNMVGSSIINKYKSEDEKTENTNTETDAE